MLDLDYLEEVTKGFDCLRKYYYLGLIRAGFTVSEIQQFEKEDSEKEYLEKQKQKRKNILGSIVFSGIIVSWLFLVSCLAMKEPMPNRSPSDYKNRDELVRIWTAPLLFSSVAILISGYFIAHELRKS